MSVSNKEEEFEKIKKKIKILYLVIFGYIIIVFILSIKFKEINKAVFFSGLSLIIIGFGTQLIGWIDSMKGDTSINIITLRTADKIVVGGILLMVLSVISELLYKILK